MVERGAQCLDGGGGGAVSRWYSMGHGVVERVVRCLGDRVWGMVSRWWSVWCGV